MRRAPRAQDLLAGDRKALARAITLVESTRADDRVAANALLEEVLPRTGSALRLGVTGPPGVGKSAFLEALGLRLVARHRVAVLAVDPSSPLFGGSILGDKTRMESLAREPRAFIRPSPGGATLGGLAAHTREAMLLCEAAGHDVVLVETIGVGQSEAEAAELCDFLLLLVQPGSGDELQGIKKGIVERADALVVTKADGTQRDTAEATRAEFAAAMRIAGGAGKPVLACSASEGTGIDAVWKLVEDSVLKLRASGELQQRRSRQALHWFEQALRERVLAEFFARPGVAEKLGQLRADVRAGKLAPTAAARRGAEG